MRIFATNALRWLATIAALIFLADALLSIYKTIVFRAGIDSEFDFFAVLLVCFVLLVISILTGLGAIAETLGGNFKGSLKTLLCTAIGIGLTFLAMNALPLSEWVKLALAGKNASVGICVALCCGLMWLTQNEKYVGTTS